MFKWECTSTQSAEYYASWSGEAGTLGATHPDRKALSRQAIVRVLETALGPPGLRPSRHHL